MKRYFLPSIIVFLLSFACVVAGYFAGAADEDNRIIATCNDNETPTIIRGVSYACLNPLMRQYLAQRLHGKEI